MTCLVALETPILRAICVRVVRGSRTYEGTRSANRGASAAATPACLVAIPPSVSPLGPPVRRTVVSRPADGVPSPAAVSPSHVCAAEVVSADGETPDPETAGGMWGKEGSSWWCYPDRTVAWGRE